MAQLINQAPKLNQFKDQSREHLELRLYPIICKNIPKKIANIAKYKTISKIASHNFSSSILRWQVAEVSVKCMVYISGSLDFLGKLYFCSRSKTRKESACYCKGTFTSVGVFG